MTLATGGVTLLSQGNEAGYVLVAVAVLASPGSTGDAQRPDDGDPRIPDDRDSPTPGERDAP